jgi:hypothetical protein
MYLPFERSNLLHLNKLQSTLPRMICAESR